MNSHTQSAIAIGSTQSSQVFPFLQELPRTVHSEGSTSEKTNRTYIRLIQTEASTEVDVHSEILSAALAAELECIFTDAKAEEFSDGTESNFSRALISYIGKNNELAIKLLSGTITSRRTNAEVAAEALRWIGYIYHPKTFRYRLWLLTNALASSSLRIRDGALLGLSFLDTTRAVPALERASESEGCELLKQDMKELLRHLKTRSRGVNAS